MAIIAMKYNDYIFLLPIGKKKLKKSAKKSENKMRD